MSAGIIRKGTLLMQSGCTDHLFIICSDPVYYPKLAKECYLAVNVTSIKPEIEHDPACILDVGDHPFIRHPSYIYYKKADIWGLVTTSQSIANGDINIHNPCEDHLFNRVLSGFEISEFVKPTVMSFFRKYC